MLPNLISIGPVVISSYIFCVFFAFIFGVFVFWKRSREEYFDEASAVDLVVYSMFYGLVLGRLGYILFNFEDFGVNIYYWIAVWEKPGLVWQGMLIGGVIAFVKFCNNKRWNVYKSLDLGVIALAMMQIWFNLGELLAGNLVGKTTNMPFGVLSVGSFEKRHPVNLYTMIMWIGVFWFLWWVEGKYRRFVWYQRSKGDARPGFLFFSYLIFFGLIGMFSSLFIELKTIVWGIDVDLIARFLVLLIGAVGLYMRSGLSMALGLEEAFAQINSRFSKKKRK